MSDQSLRSALSSDEEREFLRTLERYLADRVRPQVRDREARNAYPADFVEELVDMGVFALPVPREHGGPGTSALLSAAAFEAVGRVWIALADILSPHFSAVRVLTAHGSPEQRAQLLPRLASGELKGAVALTEPSAGTDLRNIRSTCRRNPDGGYALSVAKTMITHVVHADLVLTLTRLQDESGSDLGTVVVMLEPDDEGVTRTGSIDKLGHRGVELGEIVADGTVIGSDRIVGPTDGRGLSQMLTAMDAGRVWIAAGALGMAAEAYSLAADHVRGREAFGGTLAELPVVRERLARMWMDLGGARHWIIEACQLLDADVGWRELSPVAAAAKVAASEAARSCSTRSLQLHGGYGYTTEFDIERIFRDAILTTIAEGNNDLLLELIARQVI